MLWLFIWYSIGLPSSFAARYFLSKGIYGSQPITWGGMIVCVICGIAGPFVTLIAFVWFVCCLGDGKLDIGFLSRPVFKSSSDSGK